MVLLKKIVNRGILNRGILLFVVASTLFSINAQEKTSFLEEKKHDRVQRPSLSKARREALDLLDALAHNLTQEITAASALLDQAIGAARTIIEGDAQSPSMKLLHKDRLAYIKRLQEEYTAARKRTQELCRSTSWLKNEPAEEKQVNKL